MSMILKFISEQADEMVKNSMEKKPLRLFDGCFVIVMATGVILFLISFIFNLLKIIWH